MSANEGDADLKQQLNGFLAADDSDDEIYQDRDVDFKDIKVADINTTFRRVSLWEPPDALPMYDDTDAGPDNMPKGYKTFGPLQIFLLLLPLTLLQAVVTQTNLYYLQNLSPAEKLKPLLTVLELAVWIGIQLKMMMFWCGAQDDYWYDQGCFDAKKLMSRNRFYWIKENLHFNDKSQRPPKGHPEHSIFLIKPLVDTVNATFRKYWKLSSYVSLDEMMISFKGNNPFHRYIPRKPHPNGTKLHAICDAVHYFCVAFVVDTDTKMSIPEIAARLFKDNVVPGMTVITDRYYTCTGLVAFCLEASVGFIGSTIGNRYLAKHTLTGWDKDEAKERDRGDFDVAANADSTVCCITWKDKGIVKLTCTVNTSARAKVKRRQRGMKSFWVSAPTVAVVFDMYFHGVDRNDQLRGNGYGLALTFRAQKYTVKFFLGLLDIVLSNAWILYRVLHPSARKEHREFMRRLAAELLVWNPLNDPVYEPQSVSNLVTPNAPRNEHRLRRLNWKAGKNGVTRLHRKQAECPMCSTSLKRKRSTHGCARCMVGLCPGACHDTWHSLSRREQLSKKSRHRTLDFEDS